MKILFTTDQTHLHGGIEKVLAEKANYFADVLGYDVTILTTEQKNNIPCYALSAKISQIDIAINYHREKSYFHPSNIRKIPSHLKHWKKILNTINPDIIIVCNYAFDFYWNPFLFTRIPKLKEYHASRYFESKARETSGFASKLKFAVNDFIESKYTRLILLNPDEKQYYRSKNTKVIPNPITIPAAKANLDNKKAIAAGRIAPVKGFEKAILCWKKVIERSPDWELHIYGQGETAYINTLIDLIAENNLQNHVHILPAVDGLQTKMLDYSLYLMSSQTECYPMVLLEALSIGLPVISFNCPTGPRNIITDDKDGFLAQNQDITALAEKTLLLTADVSLRKAMGNAAITNSPRFSTPTVMKGWKDLFDTLIQ